LAEGFIALFNGMGQIKVLLVYIAETTALDRDIRRAITLTGHT
jgi:hypothetical protein